MISLKNLMLHGRMKKNLRYRNAWKKIHSKIIHTWEDRDRYSEGVQAYPLELLCHLCDLLHPESSLNRC
jgi:hypothetical protein